MIVISLSVSEKQGVSETGNNHLTATIASLISFSIFSALLYYLKYRRNKEKRTKSKVLRNDIQLNRTKNKKQFEDSIANNYNQLSRYSMKITFCTF